jgi:TolB-like protein
MKQIKSVFLLILLSGAVGFPAFSQTAISLEAAIRAVASDIGSRLPAGTSIALVNFDSASRSMSDHVLGELTNALTNERGLTVVDRGKILEAAQRELIFNLSGEVSDASAQNIGRFVGAQMVVSGSMGIAGANYSFRIQVLEVETSRMRYGETFYILNDRQVRTLMGDSAIVTNFTAGERIGAATLNLALGMGSFVIQKDPLGGSITAVLEAAGVAAIIVSRFLSKEILVGDEWGTGNWHYEMDTSLSTPVLIGGLGAYAGGAIFGIVRALSYRKPGVNIAAADLPWNIALVPDNIGSPMVMLSYTMRW